MSCCLQYPGRLTIGSGGRGDINRGGGVKIVGGKGPHID